MRICLQTRILPRPYLCVSFHVDPVISGSCHYSRVHCPKQCTALDMGSFRQQWFKTAATVFCCPLYFGRRLSANLFLFCLQSSLWSWQGTSQIYLIDKLAFAGSVGHSSLDKLIPGTRHPGSHGHNPTWTKWLTKKPSTTTWSRTTTSSSNKKDQVRETKF